MATTIQISNILLKELKARKLYDKESYEELIWNLLEDTKELSEQTKKELAMARAQVAEGKVHTFESVKKSLNL